MRLDFISLKDDSVFEATQHCNILVFKHTFIDVDWVLRLGGRDFVRNIEIRYVLTGDSLLSFFQNERFQLYTYLKIRNNKSLKLCIHSKSL